MLAEKLDKIPNPQRIKVKQDITIFLLHCQLQQETKLAN